ncbi:MAG: hypothetical protein KKE11_01295 [Gammaproteobacteria bacterium]|nr:hypothetical protein [Gammaproteobacteria bacterium]
MGLYFCPNCLNLKVRVVRKEELGRLSKYKIKKAIKENNIDSLGLPFPLNWASYKRLARYRSCKIIYCSENMLVRSLYIYREGLEGSLTPNKSEPCPKYK